MILDFLEMKNIRSFKEERIEFLEGTSLFEGDIGSGKSTILMSIEFALFGLGSQKAESLLTKTASSGQVTLGFSVGDKKYQVHRELTKKGSTVGQNSSNAWISEDEQKELLAVTELKQRILQILKFNEPENPRSISRIFRYAIFTPQETMKEVLSDAKTRLDTIRRAFGIEDYNIAASNAVDLLREIKTRLVILEERFKDVSNLENERKEFEEKITQIDKSIIDATRDKNEYEKLEGMVDNELNILRMKNNERHKIAGMINSLQSKIQDSKKEVERSLERISDHKSKLEKNTLRYNELSTIKKPDGTKTVEELDSEITKFREINNKLISYNTERDFVKSEISRIQGLLGEFTSNDKPKLVEELQELKKDNETSDNIKQTLEKELKQYEEQKIKNETEKNHQENEIDRILELGNKCPTCEQDIGKDYQQKLLASRKEKVDERIQKINDADNSIRDTKIKLCEIELKIEENESAINEIQERIPNIDTLESNTSKLNQIESEISQLEHVEPIEDLMYKKDQLVEYNNTVNEINRMNLENDDLQTKIQKEKKYLEEKESQISSDEIELNRRQKEYSTSDLEDKIQQKETELRKIRADITDATGILERLNTELTSKKSDISKHTDKINECKMWQNKHANILECSEWIEKFFIPATRKIEKQVLLSILRDFDETYRKWYSILVEDPTKESRIDEDFTPIVYQDTFEQDVGYLSGGEKTSIALAYRLTLNSLLRKEIDTMKTNLLILDEPTDGFSKNQLNKMRDVLKQLGSKQIILVSHDEELNSQVDNIFKVSKQNGVSKISTV